MERKMGWECPQHKQADTHNLLRNLMSLTQWPNSHQKTYLWAIFGLLSDHVRHKSHDFENTGPFLMRECRSLMK